MANDIRICDLCKGYQADKFAKRLEEMVPDATVEIGCQNMCGHCLKRAFIFVNGRWFIGENEEELIAKMQPRIKKSK